MRRRCRGTAAIDPIFGTYWDDDREAAMSIHWINERIDAGDIAAQQSLPLARGRPSRELYMELAAIGVELLAGVLEQVSRGQIPRQPQDESRATYESAADIARARIPFAAMAGGAGMACPQRPRRPAQRPCRRCRRTAARARPCDALSPRSRC